MVHLAFLLLFFSYTVFGCQDKTVTLTNMPWKVLWSIGSYLTDESNNDRDLRAVKCTCKDLNVRMQNEKIFWRLENGTFWCPGAQAKKAKGAALFTARRKQLVNLLEQRYPQGGAMLLTADLNPVLDRFLQESTFEYFTGMTATGIVVLIEFGQVTKTTLFLPKFSLNVAQWFPNPIEDVMQNPTKYGIDEIAQLGEVAGSLDVAPYSADNAYVNLIAHLQRIKNCGGKICTYGAKKIDTYQPRFLLERIMHMMGVEPVDADNQGFASVDDLVTLMRRKKDISEIKSFYNGLRITYDAYAHVARTYIRPGRKEVEVKLELEKIFRMQGCSHAYGSIVCSGAAAKVLHDFEDNSKKRLVKGDLLLIDAAAMCGRECADITRVFPVSGKFSILQRTLLNAVIHAQKLVAAHAHPGRLLINSDDRQYMTLNAPLSTEQEKSVSLRVLAFKSLLTNTGQKMPHGIGHHIGLDAHDICPPAAPLEVGDVFTIEPGVYDEVGLRHEDDYLMTPNGAMKLSEMFPETPEEIEHMMAKKN